MEFWTLVDDSRHSSRQLFQFAEKQEEQSGVKFSRIPDPAPLSWDPAPLFGDPAHKLKDTLEFCSAMSLLCITLHDSYKYAVKTFQYQQLNIVMSFLVTERCGDVHYYRHFILGFLF